MSLFDITLLAGLVSAAQENQDFASALNEVDSVPRAVINSHLADAMTNGFDIARVAEPEAIDPHLDASGSSPIPQRI